MAYTFGKKSSNVCCMFEEEVPSSLSSSVRSRESQLRPIESGPRELLVGVNRELCHPLDSIRGDGDEA